MGRKKIDKEIKQEARQEARKEARENGDLRPVDIIIKGGKILGRFLAMRGSNMLIKKGLTKMEVPAGEIEKVIEIKDSVMRNVFIK